MSKEDFKLPKGGKERESKELTLEETLPQRAEMISIPEEQLRKIDNCWRLDKLCTLAFTNLHSDKHECFADAEPIMAATFEALESRADAVKRLRAETDTHKLEEMMKSAKIELNFVNEKYRDKAAEKDTFDAELRELNQKRDELKSEAVHLTIDNTDPDRLNEVQLLRRRNEKDIEGKEKELAQLLEVSEQYKKDADALETEIEKLTSKINGETPAPPVKKQRKSDSSLLTLSPPTRSRYHVMMHSMGIRLTSPFPTSFTGSREKNERKGKSVRQSRRSTKKAPLRKTIKDKAVLGSPNDRANKPQTHKGGNKKRKPEGAEGEEAAQRAVTSLLLTREHTRAVSSEPKRRRARPAVCLGRERDESPRHRIPHKLGLPRPDARHKDCVLEGEAVAATIEVAPHAVSDARRLAHLGPVRRHVHCVVEGKHAVDIKVTCAGETSALWQPAGSGMQTIGGVCTGALTVARY